MYVQSCERWFLMSIKIYYIRNKVYLRKKLKSKRLVLYNRETNFIFF